MSRKVLARLLFDPTRHTVKTLKDGKRRFIVTNHEDKLLRDGLFGTLGNPVRRRQLYDLLERLYKNVFDMNANEMSEVLDELYPSGEYIRQKLYENVPSLRQKSKGLRPSEKKRIKRFLKRLSPIEKNYLQEVILKSNFSKQLIEKLGEVESEKIAKGRINRPKRRG